MAADELHDDRTRSFIALTSGAVVSHYKIIEKIGAGGMGEVYLAEDTRLKRQVALKFLQAQFAANQEMKARFTREAQAAATLKHPNIVTIYEVSEYQGRPFFAMECCEGQSLRDMIKQQKLTLSQIADLALQICEGLQEAHEAGIVHRDVKPSNIILDKKGRPKLVDFGLATIQGGEKLTRSGSTLGTIGYMSPEQIQVKKIDERSDLFTFGVVLYEMITGRLLFKGDTEAGILHSVLNDIPEPLARYKSGVSAELQQIVSKLLEKDPALRYQTAAGVISDLKRLSVPGKPIEKRKAGFWMGASVVVAIVAIAVIITTLWLDKRTNRKTENIMLAVLPFENLGDPEDEYFADGITDEITSRLGMVHRLGVISRTSAMRYKNTDKTIPQIGAELGVEYVLEGTIFWDKSSDTDRVRIIPQLIDVKNDVHVWSDKIERPLTALFAVQAGIATYVAKALDITLLESERQAVEERLTESTEAYDYYLLGLKYIDRSFSRGDVDVALELFEKAVEIDSNFALAYARLSKALSLVYWLHDADAQIQERAKLALDRAVELSPDDPMIHEALANYYYRCHRDYERALEELALAQLRLPNNFEILGTIGYIKRRQGRWQESVEYQEKSLALNPRSPRYAWDIGETYMCMRDYELANEWFDRAITLDPHWPSAHNAKAFVHLLRKGDYAAASSVLESASRTIDTEKLVYLWASPDIFSRRYQAALDRLPSDGFWSTRGLIYYLMGDTSRSAVCYDKVRLALEQQTSIGRAYDGLREASLGVVYAYLGRAEDALRLGRKAMDLLPLSVDAHQGSRIVLRMAWIHLALGDYDSAIDLLDQSLSIPSELSVAYLRGHPLYDPLRDHPRFQALIEKYEKEHGT
ncbi:MAG TPA: protein kinase [Acidobacteriota bacterium]|nr:protein kinase [Acidobacteriota bacterium]